MTGKRLAVWICNAVVAVLSILSILCYFFGPFWTFSARITLKADTIEDILGEQTGGSSSGESGEGGSLLDSIDINDIVGEDGIVIPIDFSIGTNTIFSSLGGDSEAVFAQLVDENVTAIISQLKPTLMDVAKRAVKSVAKTTVKKQLHEEIKNNPDLTSKDVDEEMEKLGITDEYMDDKMDQIIDSLLSEDATVESVTNDIMDTVEEVYGDLKANAQKLSETDPSYQDLADLELTDDVKAELRDTIEEALGNVATGDNGEINVDEFINSFLSDALKGMKDDSGNGTGSVARLDTAPDPNADEPGADEAEATLESQIRDLILDYTGDIAPYANYAFLAMGGLMLLSMLSWLYILIKLLVKLLKMGPNPTVKLKCPIWLGWLPYLILVAIPGIALMFLPTILSAVGAPSEVTSILNSISLSVSSISVIAMISAVICFGISIFYMVMRKKFKKEAKAAKEAKD